MQILVKEDHRAPVVVSMVWYRAGSMDEDNGTTGVAHVLEHMMFKGTTHLAPGQFSKTIARAGGRDNAFTNRDATAYHQQLHKSQLELAMQLEADRMANLRKDRRPVVPPSPAVPEPEPVGADVYTLRQAAQRAGVSVPTLRKWNLPFIRIGRVVRIRKESLDNFLAQHTRHTDN